MCDTDIIINEFKKIFFNETEKDIIKQSTIAEIKCPYPGRNYRKFIETNKLTIYSNTDNNILKIYCHPEKSSIFSWTDKK